MLDPERVAHQLRDVERQVNTTEVEAAATALRSTAEIIASGNASAAIGGNFDGSLNTSISLTINQYFSPPNADLVARPTGERDPSGILGTNISGTAPEDPHILELFEHLYAPIRQAIDQGSLAQAEHPLEELIQIVERMLGDSSAIQSELADFLVRLLITQGNIALLRGRRDIAVATWAKVQSRGALPPARLLQAATLLANLGDTDGLSSIVLSIRADEPERPKYLAILAAQRGHYSEALNWADQASEDSDVLLLKCRIALGNLQEPRIPETVALLDRASTLVAGHVLGLTEVAELSEDLLHQIVDQGWEVRDLERREYLQIIRRRYLSAVQRGIQDVDAFPEAAARAVLALMSFHLFLKETEAAIGLCHQHQALLNRTDMAAFAQRFVDGEAASQEQFERLSRRGIVSPVQQALHTSWLQRQSGSIVEAEQTLRAALNLDMSWPERSASLGMLMDLLAEQERFSEAEDLLDTQVPQSLEFIQLMRAHLMMMKTKDLGACIDHLRKCAELFPRSRPVLDNLVQLLHEQSYQENADPASILDEALSYSHRLLQVLPSPEIEYRHALLLHGVGKNIEALEVVTGVRNSGYEARHLVVLYARLLLLAGRHQDAAQALENATALYSGEYAVELRTGIAWAMARNPDRALTHLAPLLNEHAERVELLVALGQTHLQRAITYPDAADDAFDYFSRALSLDPSMEALPALILQAGDASGRINEAIQLISSLDLTENPYIHAGPIEEIFEVQQAANQWRMYFDAGIIPFTQFTAAAPRPAWYLWWGQMGRFVQPRGSAPRALLVSYPLLQGNFDGCLLESGSTGVLIDRTAILTIGCLKHVEAFFTALQQLGQRICMPADTLEWLQSEIDSLQGALLSAARRKFVGLYAAVREARNTVEIVENVQPREAGQIDRFEILRPYGFDLEHAIQTGSYYLNDDFIEVQKAVIPDGVLITSGQLLSSMMTLGLVRRSVAERLRQNEPAFGSGDEEAVVCFLERPVMLSSAALSVWFEAGILPHWLKGEQGWPRLVIGPWAHVELSAQAEETAIYQGALERVKLTSEFLSRAVEDNWIEQIVVPDVPRVDLGGFEQAWASALSLLSAAQNNNLTLWADDRFFQALNDERGFLFAGQDSQLALLRLRQIVGDTRFLRTEEIVGDLVQEQLFTEEDGGAFLWDMFRHGFRFLSLRPILRWLLHEHPYRVDVPPVQYSQLLGDIVNAGSIIPKTPK